MSVPPCSLLERGVHRAPFYTLEGKTILVAIDATHREIADGRIELYPDENPYVASCELWRRLDAANPEHSRRRRVREQARHSGAA